MARSKKPAKRRDRGDGRTKQGTFAPGTSGRNLPRRLPANAGWRSDAFASGVTGLGAAADKVNLHQICIDPVLPDEAELIWKSSDMGGIIVEDQPSEMFREGYEYKCDDPEVTKLVQGEIKRTGLNLLLKQAKEYHRAFGGAALMPIVENGGENLSLPIDLGAQKPLRLNHFLLFDPRDLTPVDYYGSIRDPKYRLPKTYRLTSSVPGGTPFDPSQLIHESRLIIFGARKNSRRRVVTGLAGWSDSIFTRVKRAVVAFDVSWAAVENMIIDFAQAVLKVRGLAEAVGEEGARALQNRMAGIDLSRSVLRMIMIDESESFERQQTPVSGLSDLMDRVAQRLAAAARMPLTRLLGMSPGGLHSTGQSDITFYDDETAGAQLEMTPQLEQAIDWLCAPTDGPLKGVKPDGSVVEWRPLRQPSDKEVAEARNLQADTDERYYNMAALKTRDIQESRWGGEKYSYETTLPWDEIEAADKAAPTDQELEGLRAPGAMPGDGPNKGPTSLSATAMAPGQITAMLEVMTSVNTGAISREQGVNVLSVGFNMAPAAAEKALGSPHVTTPAVLPKPYPGAPTTPGAPAGAPGQAAPAAASPGAAAPPAGP